MKPSSRVFVLLARSLFKGCKKTKKQPPQKKTKKKQQQQKTDKKKKTTTTTKKTTKTKTNKNNQRLTARKIGHSFNAVLSFVLCAQLQLSQPVSELKFCSSH